MNLEYILERKRKSGNEFEFWLVLFFCCGYKGRYYGYFCFDI